MANQDQINAMMRNFPPEADLLQMSAEDVGMHLLKYMTRARTETNRFNFLQMVPGGQIAFRRAGACRLAREGPQQDDASVGRAVAVRTQRRAQAARLPLE